MYGSDDEEVDNQDLVDAPDVAVNINAVDAKE